MSEETVLCDWSRWTEDGTSYCRKPATVEFSFNGNGSADCCPEHLDEFRRKFGGLRNVIEKEIVR
jgi:hypothetical protein